MPRSVHVFVEAESRLRVGVESDQGATLKLAGAITDLEATLEEPSALASNRALATNLWAHAKSWYTAQTLPNDGALALDDPEAQRLALKQIARARKIALKRADVYAKTAQWIADVADDVSTLDVENGWCSSCFFDTEHRKSNRPFGELPVFVCQGCGSPSAPCVAPGCPHMAVRGPGVIRLPMFCAEHRHDIPGFEKAHGTFGALHDYEDFLRYEEPDLDKASKITVGALAAAGLVAPLALAAAPAIGGAIGSLGVFGGFTGAAASSHGLALLGGGTLAAGGLGMAGGAAVVTAVGSAVGGALGLSVANAYLQEDRSFRVELLRPGSGGVPVLVASGFLSEGKPAKWGAWKAIVDRRYPDSPVYRVWWGAKELKDLGLLSIDAAGKLGGAAIAKTAAAHATRQGARIVGGMIGPTLLLADLVRNPWHVAKSRADKTGVILGDLLARTDADSYVLIGHSLGARVMAVAAEALGSKPGGPRIASAHLLGAAIGARGDWDALTAAVDGSVHCYHSVNDQVLKLVYRAAQLGEQAAGVGGFTPQSTKILNVDVSADVGSHFQYHERVELL